jgi:hypothetical protein
MLVGGTAMAGWPLTARGSCPLRIPPNAGFDHYGRDAVADLLASPLPSMSASHLPRKRSGHEGVHDAVQPAWNDSGAVFEQTAEALRCALLDAHRFQQHGLRIEAELFKHRRVRKPGCIVKRLAKVVYIRLRGSVTRHKGNAVFRTHCPHEDQAARPPLGEFRAEMGG